MAMKLPRMRGRGFRWPVILGLYRLGMLRPYPEREMDMYCLSTGRCGTHFLAHLVGASGQVDAIHDAGIHLPTAHAAAQEALAGGSVHVGKDLRRYPYIAARLQYLGMRRSRRVAEFGHHMYPFAAALANHYERYFPNRELRLVHLVRHPTACCRSMLRVERYEGGGEGFRRRAPGLVEGTSSAEDAARVWCRTNRIISDSFARITDPRKTLVLRIEDIGERWKELCQFLGLDLSAVSWGSIQELLGNESTAERHSHLQREGPGVSEYDADSAELEIVERMTRRERRRFDYS